MIVLNQEELQRDIQYQNMINAITASKHESNDRMSSLRTSKMVSIINSYNFTSAYKNKSKVAFVGEQFPIELILALKVIPFNLETMAALLSRSDNLKTYFTLGDENNLSRDVCSVLRGEFGLGLSNCLPTPDVMVSCNHPCDGYMKIIFNLQKLYNKRVCSMDVPAVANDVTISYVEAQLRNMAKDIGSELNIKLEESDLMEVVNNSNQAKEYYYKTLDMFENSYLPDVSHELMMIAMVNLWGSKEIIKVCKTLYEEALEIREKQKEKKMRKRVIWFGQMSFFSDQIIEYIEKEVEIIYFGPFVNYRDRINPENPYRSLAKRFITYSWNPFTMSETIHQFSTKFKISGIILQNAWGCRDILGVNNMLRDAAKENKLKILMLDNDFLDKEKVAFDHVKNRIDAFMEILQ